MAALPSFTFPDEAVISLNARILIATGIVALVTAVLFGLAPAVGSFSQNLSESLKAGGRGNSGFRRGRLRNGLIITEVALAVMLLSGAGLMMRSFLIERTAQLGIVAPEKLVVSDIALGKNYKTVDQQSRFVRELVSRLQTIPGVTNASGALDFPPFGGINTDFDIAGKTHSEAWKGQMGFVDAQFFRTLGVRLLRGRLLTGEDILNKRKVAVINQTLAKKYFSGEDPIGKQIRLIGLEKAPIPVANPWFEIVGVMSDVRNHGVTDAVQPEAYGPITITAFGEYIVYLRAAGNPAPLGKLLDGEILKMDKNVHPQNTGTLELDLNQFEYAQPRFALEIFSVFAAIGLVLVSVGVYSVVSYTVSQQNREIGIRMALGATRANVMRLVLFGGMRYVSAGLAAGILVGVLILRFMKSQISGLSTYDPLTLMGVVVLLAVVASGACYLPSLRATRVDPLVSLRYE